MTDIVQNCTDKADLFASPYMEDFSKEDFLEDNPEATAKEIQAAYTAHSNLQSMAVATAKSECYACPALEWCKQQALKIEEPVYGVMAGMTEKERRKFKKSGGTKLVLDSATAALLAG